ncbi:MAG: response regulator transcription factor [Chloroflexi bacterium]|nr:MAG: response regulator transcription factor [Chloroflexota bacterium]
MSTATADRRLRIVIADDHPSIRENLRYLIGAEADLEVVGVVRDGMSALRLARKLRPDVLVIDHDMPDYSGLTVAQALRREAGAPLVLLYTMDTEACAHAKHARVLCVNKDAPPKVLLEAIRTLGPEVLARPNTRTRRRGRCGCPWRDRHGASRGRTGDHRDPRRG